VISRSDLDELVAMDARPAVSIYLPTHVAGREIRKDPIRLNRIHKLPIPVPEETLLGDHFHIKPLLPLIEDAGSFWLLTISAKHTRLFHTSRWEFS
jgi:hypothetical protein